MGKIRRAITELFGEPETRELPVVYFDPAPTVRTQQSLSYVEYDGTERGLAKAAEEAPVVRLSRQVTELTYALQEAKRELDRRDHELQVAGVEQHNAMEFVRQANLGRHGEIMAFKEKNDALLAAFQEKTEEMKLAEQSQLRKENDELVLEVMRLRGQLQGQLSADATRRLLADQNGE